MSREVGSPPQHALTIDVEDWFHDDWRPDRGVDWDRLPSTLSADVGLLLELLAAAGSRATFFVLGDVAAREPALVRRIVAAGHEIASHGYRHRSVGTWLRREFRADVERSLRLLEDQTGAKVHGYRAPYFSIKAGVRWPTEVLAELGVTYDSSVLPIDRPPGLELVSPRAPYRLASGIWEVPVAVNRYGWWNLPLLGGFALRTLPLRFVDTRLVEFNLEVGPAVVHVHPWELDEQGPEPQSVSVAVRWLKRLGRRRLPDKLGGLLGAHSFVSIARAFPEVGAEPTQRHDSPSA